MLPVVLRPITFVTLIIREKTCKMRVGLPPLSIKKPPPGAHFNTQMNKYNPKTEEGLQR